MRQREVYSNASIFDSWLLNGMPKCFPRPISSLTPAATRNEKKLSCIVFEDGGFRNHANLGVFAVITARRDGQHS